MHARRPLEVEALRDVAACPAHSRKPVDDISGRDGELLVDRCVVRSEVWRADLAQVAELRVSGVDLLQRREHLVEGAECVGTVPLVLETQIQEYTGARLGCDVTALGAVDEALFFWRTVEDAYSVV